MSNQYKAVAAVLKNSIESINAILTSPEDEMHRIRIVNNLQLQADQLLLLTGAGDLTTEQPPVLGPATTIGGKPISKVRRFTEADLVPSDDKVFDLKKQVENAVIYFAPDANAEGILANIPELVIRGVAKKAGMKVTKDEPRELTVEFIEQVKAAVALLPKEKEEDLEDDDNENPHLKGQGGVSKSFVLNPEDIGEPLGTGKVDAPGKEPLITDPAPVVQPEEPKIEELKQEPKPDTKKKTGK